MFNIKFNQKNKLRVFEGFSCIGSQRMSLENIGVPHEVVAISDEYFKKAESVTSNKQLYKQAGNSIVVNVLEDIFKNMFID